VGRPKQRKTDKIFDIGKVMFLLGKEISLKIKIIIRIISK
jgi:hypothetical protein